MNTPNTEYLIPKKITLYGDVSLESINGSLYLEKSQMVLTQTFSGDLNGELKFCTDLNLANLKKGQLGHIEGIICEAFNILANEYYLNLADSHNLKIYKMPTRVQRELKSPMTSSHVYKLNFMDHYCHCVLSVTTGV